MSYSRGSPHPVIEPESLVSPAFAGRFFTTTATSEAQSIQQLTIDFNLLKLFMISLLKLSHLCSLLYS